MENYFNFSGGTFTAPSSVMHCKRNWAHNTSGTFLHNNGTVRFEGSSTSTIQVVGKKETFYNLTINKSSGAFTYLNAINDTLRVLHDVRFENGSIAPSSSSNPCVIEVQNDVDLLSSFGTVAYNVELLFTGTANQEIDLNSGLTKIDGGITINKGFGNLRLDSDITMDGNGSNQGDIKLVKGSLFLNGNTLNNTISALRVSGNSTIIGSGTLNAYNYFQTNGTLNFSSTAVSMRFYNDFTISSGNFYSASTTLDIDRNFIQSGGIFHAPRTNMYIGGGFNHTSGTFDHNFGKVTFDGTVNNWQGINFPGSGHDEFFNLDFNQPSNCWYEKLYENDTMIVTGDLRLMRGQFWSRNSEVSGVRNILKLKGDLTIEANYCGSAQHQNDIIFVCGDNQTIDMTTDADNYRGMFIVNKTSGTVKLLSNLTLGAHNTSQKFIVGNGTLDLNGYTITLQGSSAIEKYNGGTINLNGGSISGGSITTIVGNYAADSYECTGPTRQVCWSVSDADDIAYKFYYDDPTTVLQQVNVESSPEAATLNLAGDTLFYLNIDDLYFIDLTAATPTSTLLKADFDGGGLDGVMFGNGKDWSDYDAMTVDMQGNLWAGTKSTEAAMVAINSKTGLPIQDFFGSGQDYMGVLTPGSGKFDCMAIDPLSGYVFANLNDGGGSTGDELYRINPTNGDTTKIATFALEDIEGMGFDGQGRLLITDGGSGTGTESLWLVDIDAGTISFVADNPGDDTEACDCVIGSSVALNEISGYVFWDQDRDTIYNNSDTSHRNYNVSIYRDINMNGRYEAGTDTLIVALTTNANGYYYHRMPYYGGEDRLVIVSDANDLPTSTNYTTDNIETAIFVSGGNVDQNNNFGYSEGGNTISGYVFYDANIDSVRQGSETGTPVVSVFLYNDINANGKFDVGTDTYRDSTLTNGIGFYSFNVAYSGSGTDYFVIFIDTLNDILPDSMTTDNIETAAFPAELLSDNNNNFGHYDTSGGEGFNTITGTVFYDVNANGIYNNGTDNEDPDVTVFLYRDVDGNGSIGGSDTLMDALETNINGFYSFTVPYTGTVTKSINLAISANNNDAEESSGGTIDRGSSALEIGNKMVGLHFPNINILQGAEIINAYIIFTERTTETATTTTTIYADDVDNSLAISSSSGDLSDRISTSATVAWNITSAWASNDTTHTPSLKTIVQELVDRPGWVANNDMTFLTSIGTGGRTASSRDDNTSEAPRLVIEYSGPATDRFLTTIDLGDLPSNYHLTTDNIESATFTSRGNTDANNDFGYDTIQPNYGTNTITGTVFFDVNSNGAYDKGTDDDDQGVTVLIYNDVNGNGVIDDEDVLVKTIDSDANGFYTTTVPYSGVESTCISVETTQGSDDAEESSGGSTNITDSGLQFGERIVGLRFLPSTLNQGISIDSAYLFMMGKIDNQSGPAASEFYGELSTSSVTFSTSGSNNITGRTGTDATYDWTFGTWHDAVRFQSGDMKNILQELVDQPGWTTSSPVTLIAGLGSGVRDGSSIEASGGVEPPILKVCYQGPATDSFLITIDTNDVPDNYHFTTTQNHTAVFADSNLTDANNDFGYDTLAGNRITGTVFWDLNKDTLLSVSDKGEKSVTVNLYEDVDSSRTVSSGDILLKQATTNSSGYYSLFAPWYDSTETTFEQRIDDGNFDREEDPSTGSISTSSSDLNVGDQIVGLYFTVDVPKNVFITEAYIEFTASASDNGAITVPIYGEDVDNATTLSGSTNNISSRTPTTANVNWSIPADGWSSNDIKQTPNLRSIISEITSRTNWASGNAMVIILDEASVGSDQRRVESEDGTSSEAPKLVIKYKVRNKIDHFVLNIETDDLPPASILTTNNIETAKFETFNQVDPNNDFGYRLDSTGINIINGTVWADEDEDGTRDVTELVRIPNMTVSLYNDANCNGVINSGFDTVMQTQTPGADGFYQFITDFTYSNTTTFRDSILVKADDVEQDNGSSSLNTGSTTLEYGEKNVGLRFDNISVPQGAVIVSAKLMLRARSDQSGAVDPVVIYGDDQDNSLAFAAATNQRVNDRTNTSNSVSWTPADPWVNTTFYELPDVKDIVQEIVDRTGWSTGNAMSFLFMYNGQSVGREGSSSDEGTDPEGRAPKLIIEYATGVNTNCFITKISTSNKPSGSHITTPETQTASFTSIGNIDSLNDFGFWGGILPVEWYKFDVYKINGSSLLEWSTASEKDNSHFTIEHSTDGVIFKVIEDYIPAVGNSNTITDYSYIHSDVSKGYNYYRIKQTDFNGAFDYSIVRVVNFGDKAEVISVYPNPSNGSFHVTFEPSVRVSNVDITLLDIHGRMLKSNSYSKKTVNEHEVRITTPGLAQGVYFLQIRNGETTTTKRLMINF